MARVEFLAVVPDLIELFNKGYGYTLAHENLVAQKKITMPFKTFYKYASNLRADLKKEEIKKTSNLKNTENKGGLGISPKNNEFWSQKDTRCQKINLIIK